MDYINNVVILGFDGIGKTNDIVPEGEILPPAPSFDIFLIDYADNTEYIDKSGNNNNLIEEWVDNSIFTIDYKKDFEYIDKSNNNNDLINNIESGVALNDIFLINFDIPSCFDINFVADISSNNNNLITNYEPIQIAG